MAKVLLAEDDAFLALIVETELRSDHEVVRVPDGEAVFRSIERSRPDIILLDLIMPNMDGFQVLEKLKRDVSLSSIPVLVLTNLGEKQDIERAMKAGAADVLVKVNYAPRELHEKINQFCNKLDKNEQRR